LYRREEHAGAADIAAEQTVDIRGRETGEESEKEKDLPTVFDVRGFQRHRVQRLDPSSTGI